MSAHTFFVPGRPVPKGRPRVTTRGTYTPKRTRAYERDVGLCALAAGVRPLSGRVGLKVTFRVRDARADLDNLGKAILDGLNGVAYGDDAHVDTLLLVRERVTSEGEQGAHVEVWGGGEGLAVVAAPEAL